MMASLMVYVLSNIAENSGYEQKENNESQQMLFYTFVLYYIYKSVNLPHEGFMPLIYNIHT